MLAIVLVAGAALSASVATVVAGVVAGQDPAAPAGPELAFGGIRMLPGYRSHVPAGDHPEWAVSKEGGVTIRYDGGNVANVVHNHVRDAAADGSALWTREQVLNGRRVDVAMTRDGRLLVSIEPFNFEARVESAEQATDVLLMVLTHVSVDERK